MDTAGGLDCRCLVCPLVFAPYQRAVLFVSLSPARQGKVRIASICPNYSLFHALVYRHF